MDNALKHLSDAKASFPAASLEVKTAERNYHEAVETYRTTPDGLLQVAKTNPELVHKYQKTRDYQVEALNEIRNGRFSKISSLLTSSQDFFDEEEANSVLHSLRKASDRMHIKDVSKETTELSKDEQNRQYQSILNHFEARLKERQRGALTSEQMETLTALRGQVPPKESTSLTTYGQALSALAQSRHVMKKEIQRIATLQDVSPTIAGAYHDAYRQEYKTKYANLAPKQQPNPPKEWVEGQYGTTGFQNDATTRLAPSDPATMYATYRLRSDMKAIPDYLKNSRNIATLNVENGNAHIVLCNNKGKQVENTHIPVDDIPKAITTLQGRIMVLNNDADTKDWLLALSKSGNLKSSVISTTEFSSKHFNLPDNSIPTLCQAMKVEPNGPKAEATMKAYLAARNKVSSSWNSKAPRRHAPPLEDMPLDTRWR